MSKYFIKDNNHIHFQSKNKINDILTLSNKNKNVIKKEFSFTFLLDEPIIIENNRNVKLALNNIFYNSSKTSYLKIKLYGVKNNIEIKELKNNKISFYLNNILTMFKNNSNIEENLNEYKNELSSVFATIQNNKDNFINDSYLIKSFSYLKQIKNYVTWKKFNEISSDNFKKLNHEYIIKFEKLLKEYTDIINKRLKISKI